MLFSSKKSRNLFYLIFSRILFTEGSTDIGRDDRSSHGSGGYGCGDSGCGCNDGIQWKLS